MNKQFSSAKCYRLSSFLSRKIKSSLNKKKLMQAVMLLSFLFFSKLSFGKTFFVSFLEDFKEKWEIQTNEILKSEGTTALLSNTCAITNPFPGFPIDFLNDDTGWIDYDLDNDLILTDNGDGTKSISGSIINATPVDFGSGSNGVTCGADDAWVLNLTLSDQKNWTEWQSMGGQANIDGSCGPTVPENIEYWHVTGTLTGTGCRSGETITINGPSAPQYRFQIGIGANRGSTDCSLFGLSTWFDSSWDNGTTISTVQSDIYGFVDESCFSRSLDISASAQNCTETSPNVYTADWEVVINYSNLLAGDIGYRRNSEPNQTFTPSTSPETVNIVGVPADGALYDTIYVFTVNDVTCADTIILKRPLPCPADIASCASTSGCIGGNVFEDFNCNGIDDTEPGVQGIQVQIYDCDNTLVGTTYSDTDGDWQICSLIDGTTYRIEFVLPEAIACWASPTHVADSGNQSEVQFLTAPACTQFSISNPSDYCQSDPNIVTSCYVLGDPDGGGTTGGLAAIVQIPWNASGSSSVNTYIGNMDDVGAVWGLAYQSYGEKLILGSIVKRHVGLIDDKTGVIFVRDMNSGVISELVNLQTLGINTGSFSNNRMLPINYDDNNEDSEAFGMVGKSGLGDIELSSDEKTLYVANLFDRKIYQMEIGIPASTPTSISEIPNAPWLSGTPCNDGVARPWGLKVNRGKLYVGLVCTAENGGAQADLTATVYSYEFATDNWNTVLTFPLDYPRDVATGRAGLEASDQWYPWIDDVFDLNDYPNADRLGVKFISRPMPILSDIEFEDSGAMILGFTDRGGHMFGGNVLAPDGSFDVNYNSGGDILRVCLDANGDYVLENNGSCGGVIGLGAGNGPGGAEFYDDDNSSWNPFGTGGEHNEVAQGGLVQLKGVNYVISTAMDPLDYNEGGIIRFNNDGSSPDGNRYTIFAGSADDGVLDKANGLGDLEVFCDPAPLEIGNYIWCDSIQNGIQDACERGIDSMIIHLYDRSNVLVGIDTSTNGNYYFNQFNVDTTGIVVDGSGVATPNTGWSGMSYDTDYQIVFGFGQYQGADGTFEIGTQTYQGYTTFNAGNNDNIDSDVEGATFLTFSGSKLRFYPEINMRTPSIGCGAHNYDLGLLCGEIFYSLGNQVFLDSDNSGDLNGSEQGIDGVQLRLLNLDNSVYDSDTMTIGIQELIVTTANNGYYRFDSLLSAGYRVEILADNFTAGNILEGFSSSTGPNEEIAPNTNGDSNDNGIDEVSGAIRSRIVSLGSLEPTNETEPVSYAVGSTTGNPANDDLSNLTVDFGFVPCQLDIQSVTSSNCTESSPGTFTAQWDIIIEATGLAGTTVNYRRNSEAAATYTPAATPETTTISITGVPADGGLSDTIYVFVGANPTCADTFIIKRPLPCPADIASCSSTPGCIGGNVFEDFNCNGIDDTEPGVQGIEVQIYDCDNALVETTYSDSDGDWQVCGLTDGEAYRIEFVLPEAIACWATPTHVSNDNGTDIQFLTAPACTKFSLSNPADYCDSNPDFAATCFVAGVPVARDVIISYPYTSTSTTGTPGAHLIEAQGTDVGSVWGLAVDPVKQYLYSSTFLKRHVGIGNGGLGAIYRTDLSTGSNGNLFTTIPNTGTVPSNATRGLPTYPNYESLDEDVFDLVGKTGLGDIDISEDFSTLYTFNLNEQQLYGIDIASGTVTALGNPGTLTCNNGVGRPFAVKVHNGLVYTGWVCTQELQNITATSDYSQISDLSAHVFTYDPSNANWSNSILNIPLNYTRGSAAGGNIPINQWIPWQDTDELLYSIGVPLCSNCSSTNGSGDPENGFFALPQPMFADIEFTRDSNMVISIMDRAGHQAGTANLRLHSANNPFAISHPSATYTNSSFGDILVASDNGNGTFTLESNATVGSTTTAGSGNNQGPGGGEYYYEDFGDGGFHDDAIIGGLGVKLDAGEVAVQVMDYFGTYQGNTAFYDINTGGRLRGFTLYGNSVGGFGKANGLGDLELICAPAPLEIGNYVWCDSIENGIQDACERGINDIIVSLYDRNGLLVGQDTTSNLGQYYFNQNNVDTTGITINVSGIATPASGNFTGMSYSSQYFIVFGSGQFATDEFTVGSNTYGITAMANVGSNDNIDSDVDGSSLTTGTLGARPDGLPFIDMTTSSTGCGDHKYDLGVTCSVCVNPIASISAIQPSCNSGMAQSDGYLQLSTVTDGDKLNFSTGSTYTGPTDYSDGSAVTIGAVPFQFNTGLNNPTGSQDYTIRVFNGSSNCFTDYTVSMNEQICTPDIDYPDYDPPTYSCVNTPCHIISNDIYLGAGVTPDSAPAGNSNADIDEDDGVSVFANMQWVPGNTVQIPVSIYNNTGTDAYLRMWIDWNGDGNFENIGEQVENSSYPATGTVANIIFVSVTIPTTAIQTKAIALRTRLSTDDINSATPCGTGSCASDGEIEDYIINISCPTPLCPPVNLQIRQG